MRTIRVMRVDTMVRIVSRHGVVDGGQIDVVGAAVLVLVNFGVVDVVLGASLLQRQAHRFFGRHRGPSAGLFGIVV